MSVTTLTHGENATILHRLSGVVHAIFERIALQRQYRRTLNELSALSDRELKDLGLCRSMVRRVSYEAVYEGQ